MMNALSKVAGVAAVLVILLIVGGGALYFFYPKNLARRPPEIDTLRVATLKQTHVEADFLLQTNVLGDPNLEGNVQVVFAHVPPQADKAELERVARSLIKEHLPNAKEVDVRFGDNLRTKPLEIDEEESPFGKKKKKKGLLPILRGTP